MNVDATKVVDWNFIINRTGRLFYLFILNIILIVDVVVVDFVVDDVVDVVVVVGELKTTRRSVVFNCSLNSSYCSMEQSLTTTV